MIFSPTDSPQDSSFRTTQIWGSSRISKGVIQSDGIKWDWGRYELAIFDLYATVKPEIVQNWTNVAIDH